MVDSVGFVNAVAGAPSYNGRMLRQLNGVGFAGATAARPLGARSGVRPGTPATTVSVTSTTWTCQPFAGLLDGQAAAEAGPYAFAFDAVATGAIAAASASIARVDIIYVQIDDPSESDGSSVPAATRKYLAGTVASTPPATPGRSIVIAHINVPISGGGSPTVTWKAPYCAAAGGIVDFNTKAELDLWTTAPAWQSARVLADGAEYVRSGSTWRQAMGRPEMLRLKLTATALLGTGGEVTLGNGSNGGVFAAAVENTGGFTISSGVITFTRAGLYQLTGMVGLTGTGDHFYAWMKNGTAAANRIATALAPGLSQVTLVAETDFAVGDTAQFRVFQASGAAQTLSASDGGALNEVIKIRQVGTA